MSGSVRLVRLDPETCDWPAMDRFADRQIFQTREWLSFLAATQGGEIVVAALEEAGEVVGYFSGLVIRRFGFRILGSPFPGWSTGYLGFNLTPGVFRPAAWQALPAFAFGDLKCLHLEARDRFTVPGDLDGLAFTPQRPLRLFEIDLSRSEDEILAGMDSNRRRNIKQAVRNGVVMEEAEGVDFADDYYPQMLDVFAKQNLVPNYGIERVRSLIRHVHPTGRLLLLRARDPDGAAIATGIFPAYNGTMYFWGGASWRHAQRLRPNDLLMWTAIQYWRARGVVSFDMGGGGDYKRRYGPSESSVPTASLSRNRAVLSLRNTAEAFVEGRQRLHGWRAARTHRGAGVATLSPGDADGRPAG